jgi:UTP:GlnB (protein PII) uridylyltransferase
MPDSEDLLSFSASMPARYSQAFDWLAIGQHAQIVAARNQRRANIGTFTSLRRAGTALCVVAPDQPGLLAIISAAFARCELDIIEAEIFTRHASPSQSEAVDLFWVHRRSPLHPHAINQVDIVRLRDILISLLQIDSELAPARTSAFIHKPATSSTKIRFTDDASGSFAILELETNDRSGLWLAVFQALRAEAVQIVGSAIKAREGRVQGRFDLVELDDSPIASDRRRGIQLAVLAAIDEIPRLTAAAMPG